MKAALLAMLQNPLLYERPLLDNLISWFNHNDNLFFQSPDTYPYVVW